MANIQRWDFYGEYVPDEFIKAGEAISMADGRFVLYMDHVKALQEAGISIQEEA